MAEVMTSAPHTIGADAPIEAARRMMAAFGVGHLPVRDEGRLVGVVAEADLRKRAAHRPVCEVMDRHPLVVAPFDATAEVESAMLARRSAAAIVVSGERVVGIFTATDALALELEGQ
jgi:acetoin utilization protein AcuB